MSGKYLEMMLKISGQIDKTYPESVRKAIADASDLQNKLKKLQGIDANREKYQKLAQDASVLGAKFNDAKAQVASLGAEFQRAQNTAAQYKAQLDKAQMALAGMSKSANPDAYRLVKQQISHLRDEYKIAAAAAKTSGTEFKQAANTAKTVGSAYNRNQEELTRLSDRLQQAGFNTQQFAASQNVLQQELGQTGEALKQAKQVQTQYIGQQARMAGMRNAASNAQQDFYNAYGNMQAAMTMTRQIASPFVDATRDAMSFQSAMADVRKVVDFDTPEQFEQMQKDILALTRTLPMTQEEIAKIVAAGGQSGIARENLLDFAESAAKMGVAFDITADQAGEMMAKWRTAFKMNQDQVVTLADQINYLGNTTAASATKISDVVTRIGPLGEIGGVAAGEIAALGASMVGSGVESEVAATSIKNLILAMTAGESATKKQQEAFDQLGINAEELAVRMQTDAKGAIVDFFTTLQSMDDAQRGAVLREIVGKESIEGLSGFLNNLDLLKENFGKVADASKYAGSMQGEFDARCQTAENATKLLDNATKELSINIGSAFLPYVAEAAEAIAKMTSGFADWAKEHETAVQWIGLVAGVLGAATVAAFGLLTAIAGFNLATTQIALFTATVKGSTLAMQLANKVSLAWQAVTTGLRNAQLLLNAALSANPIGLVIIAIIALVAAGIYLYKNWEKVKAFMASLWDSPAAAVLAFIAGPIGWIIYAAAGLISHWEEVKAWFTLLWNDPSAALEVFVNMVKNKFASMYQYVAEKWSKLKYILSNPITAAVNFVEHGNVYGSMVHQSSGMSADEIRGLASGGFVNHPQLTWLAEGGYPEAVIPLDGTARAMELWQQAGAALGVPTFNQEMPAMRQVSVSTAQTRPEIAIPEINMPEMPEIVNVIPEISMPESAPQEIYVPRISVPETYIESQPTPDITIPEMPFMQQVLPEIAVPAISTARQIPHEANPQVELLSNAADIIHKAASVMRAESTENAILETPVVRSGGSNVNIEFSAPITINGDADNRTVAQIADAAQQMKRQFEDMFRDMMAQQRRVSFD